MNAYPSWIHRIPEMIGTLALADRELIDRQTVERLFDLRKTAAFQLLRRMGAEPVGHSLVISRTLLMARLREAHEHPHWHWERERRIRIRERIDQLRPANRKSIVPVTRDLRERMEVLAITFAKALLIGCLCYAVIRAPGEATHARRPEPGYRLRNIETADRTTRAQATGIGFEEKFRAGEAGFLIALRPGLTWALARKHFRH
jgi:hypothetical protein